MVDRLRFGIFMAPFHPAGENPTLALERDLDLIEHLDGLGWDEAWIGEHHSAGYEIIASPEVFIAAVAQRTKHIRLGTGVSSLPYHHPLILADRINQLDLRLTKIFRRGRTRVQGMFDIYNIFNCNAVISEITRLGPTFRTPTLILGGRLLRFGVQVDF